MPQFPFIGAAYAARSVNIDAQRCVNLYPEVSGSGTSKSPVALIGTPGLRMFASLPESGGTRGALRPASGSAVVVCGAFVYRVDSTGTATAVAGSLMTNTGTVSMADNGQVVVIVDGPYGYWLDLATSTLTQITDSAFYGADRVAYIDGYFIFNRPGTQQFYLSSLFAQTFDSLDFASAEGAPDKLISLLADHRELWLFGDSSTEVFFNSGNADFPFERIQGAFIEVGCAAVHSVAKLDNSVFWLGKDDKGQGTVWKANGYQPARISTHALETALASYSQIDDAVAWVYQQEGHAFYVLNFPAADRTWVFDAATGLWHERAWHDTYGNQRRHRGACHMAFAGENIVGDWENGNLYALDLNTATDNGDAIHRIRAAAHVADADYRNQFHRSLQIDMETGVGLQSGQGSDPQAMLQWSDDGGHTWSNEHWASIGQVGKYKTRVRWRRLGRSRDRVYRVTITDPVKVVMIGASLILGVGAS